jgi:hypothetical protein
VLQQHKVSWVGPALAVTHDSGGLGERLVTGIITTVANEKQRRRRAKEKRHAYELVEIDEEGNETVLTASELKSAEPAEKSKKASTKSAGSGRGRGRGTPQPASWSRVLRRGAIAAPLFFVMVMLLGGKSVTATSAALNTMLLLVLFVPFSYVLDGFVYRSYQKRLAKPKSKSR